MTKLLTHNVLNVFYSRYLFYLNVLNVFNNDQEEIKNKQTVITQLLKLKIL